MPISSARWIDGLHMVYTDGIFVSGNIQSNDEKWFYKFGFV